MKVSVDPITHSYKFRIRMGSCRFKLNLWILGAQTHASRNAQTTGRRSELCLILKSWNYDVREVKSLAKYRRHISFPGGWKCLYPFGVWSQWTITVCDLDTALSQSPPWIGYREHYATRPWTGCIHSIFLGDIWSIHRKQSITPSGKGTVRLLW